MNLFTRFSLVTVLTLAALAAVGGFTYHSAQNRLDALVTDQVDAHQTYFYSATELQGAGLKGLTSSYSWWSDMVAFMATPDASWATDNIDNLVGFSGGCDALWVLQPDYAVVHAIDTDFRRPPIPYRSPAELRAAIKGNFEFNYFAVIDGQVWQIFGAAVQDPQFWRHETPVVGYLLLGKRWDDTWLARLGRLNQARLRIEIPAASSPTQASVNRYQFRAPLNDPFNQPLATVIGYFDATAIEQIRHSVGEQVLTYTIGTLLLLALLGWFVGTNIVLPLGRITRSLESRNPIHLADLLVAKSDFGEIARLLSSQFRQGRMLQDEIRRRVAAIDPATETGQRESNEALRLRLASNLHDGPLQSLYAAGLKISSLETATTVGRAPSPAQLSDIRTILTECSADLRNLLLDLEPEELRDQDLESALQRFERYLQSVSRTTAQLSIEEGILDGLAREAQLHVYYITRELISNAARHARPEHTSLQFRREADFLVIHWENDGFALNDPIRPGNGLHNIGQRVQQMEGTWSYRVHRSRLWQVTIEIPFTAVAQPMTLDSPAPLPLPSRTPQD